MRYDNLIVRQRLKVFEPPRSDPDAASESEDGGTIGGKLGIDRFFHDIYVRYKYYPCGCIMGSSATNQSRFWAIDRYRSSAQSGDPHAPCTVKDRESSSIRFLCLCSALQSRSCSRVDVLKGIWGGGGAQPSPRDPLTSFDQEPLSNRSRFTTKLSFMSLGVDRDTN